MRKSLQEREALVSVKTCLGKNVLKFLELMMLHGNLSTVLIKWDEGS